MFFAGNPIFSAMGLATMIVVFLAMIGSVTVLPALLHKLGDRVERGGIPLPAAERPAGPRSGRRSCGRSLRPAGLVARVALRRRCSSPPHLPRAHDAHEAAELHRPASQRRRSSARTSAILGVPGLAGAGGGRASRRWTSTRRRSRREVHATRAPRARERPGDARRSRRGSARDAHRRGDRSAARRDRRRRRRRCGRSRLLRGRLLPATDRRAAAGVEYATTGVTAGDGGLQQPDEGAAARSCSPSSSGSRSCCCWSPSARS